ncbi:MAG: pirin-like C-terminal cupin domain-containing protein [Woeseia sp.]
MQNPFPSGSTHSERTPEALRGGGSRLFGLQTWVSLPAAHEETEPAFAHTPEAELPLIEDDGVRVRLVAGSAWGRTSPVKVFSDTIYADVALAAGGKLPVAAAHEERALYTVSGEVEIGGVRFPAGQLLVLRPGDPVTIGNSGPEPAQWGGL